MLLLESSLTYESYVVEWYTLSGTVVPLIVNLDRDDRGSGSEKDGMVFEVDEPNGTFPRATGVGRRSF